MSDSTLSSRTVLVTGATSGIGHETARQLAERGATVLLHGRTAEETRAAADRLVATAGVKADQPATHFADFTHLGEVETLARTVVAAHPHLDVPRPRTARSGASPGWLTCWSAAPPEEPSPVEESTYVSKRARKKKARRKKKADHGHKAGQS